MKTLTAQTFPGAGTGFGERLRHAFTAWRRAARDARDRKAAIRELSRLNERLLVDVGIERHEIERVVDEMIAARHPATARAAPAPARTADADPLGASGVCPA